MKKWLQMFLVVAMLGSRVVHAESSSSQPTTSIKELEKTAQHDETVKRVFEQDGIVYKRVGNETTGYMTVKDALLRFKDVNNHDENLIQYSLDGYNILTLTKIDLSQLTREQVAAFDIEQVVSNIIDGVQVGQGQYEVIPLEAKDDFEELVAVDAIIHNKRILNLVFTPKGNEKMFYFISIEGTDEFVVSEMETTLFSWKKTP